MRWISAISGIIATGAALAVLISLPTPADGSDGANLPIAETASIGSPAQELPVQEFVVEQPIERDLNIADLSDDLTDVLAEGGYTQFVGADELSVSLPDDVVQVLISEEAVLVIPSEDGS